MHRGIERAMDALFAGQSKHVSHSVFTEQEGEYDKTNGGFLPTVYSYGHHFPLVILADEDTVLFNDRKYSRTTTRHQSSTRVYLHYEGFEDSGERRSGYQVYKRVTGKRWPHWNRETGYFECGEKR